MAMNVFNSAGTAFLGPQPFAFDRAAMLAGTPATFVTPRDSSVFSSANDALLPGDLDGSTLPPAGAPAPFLMSGRELDLEALALPRRLRHAGQLDLHARRQPDARRLTRRSARRLAQCVPAARCRGELESRRHRRPRHVPPRLPPLRRRPRGARRQPVIVVSAAWPGSAGTRSTTRPSGPRLCRSRAPTSPTRPGAGWAARRWTGSGDLALGFSASSATINPQIRYAGRLAGDPVNTLAQGEAHAVRRHRQPDRHRNRWGDYSDLTVDPVDDCTFWYTQEYYSTTAPSTGGRASATSSSLPATRLRLHLRHRPRPRHLRLHPRLRLRRPRLLPGR